MRRPAPAPAAEPGSCGTWLGYDTSAAAKSLAETICATGALHDQPGLCCHEEGDDVRREAHASQTLWLHAQSLCAGVDQPFVCAALTLPSAAVRVPAMQSARRAPLRPGRGSARSVAG